MYMKKLQGKTLMKKSEVILHTPQGRKVEKDDIETELQGVWRPIYQKRENKIDEVWNPDIKRHYKEKMENDKNKTKITLNIDGIEIEIQRDLREHYDTVAKLNLKNIKPMKETIITKEDIKKQLKRLKEGKAPGPDGIKPEIYKALVDSDIGINALQQSYKKIIDNGEKSRKWNKSKTTLTPKIKKPTAKDLRPIALTNISYKIFMGIIREKVEEHLEENGLNNELQAGFTKNRRITDNLFILKYCIESSFKNKKELYVI